MSSTSFHVSLPRSDQVRRAACAQRLAAMLLVLGTAAFCEAAATGPAAMIVSTHSLETTEAPGPQHTATFTIRLATPPTEDVTISLSSSDTTEGTVTGLSLIFTDSNWGTPQAMTVIGVDDDVDDGDITCTVTVTAASHDWSYDGLAAEISVTNVDDDTAGITVSPTSGLETTETGGTATFAVVLNSEPTDYVTIGLSSSDPTEGAVAPTSLILDPYNWSVPQIVTVTGVNDDIDDGDVDYTILIAPAVSGDPNYDNLGADDVSVTNLDDGDSVGITVNPTSDLVTTEADGFAHTAKFTVVLNSEPTDYVTIGLSSSDTAEGTVEPASLTFDANHPWNVPQTVTVTGVNDDIDDGDILYHVVTGPAVSGDPLYSDLDADDVSVTNVDDDTAGITVSPTSGLETTETGGTATFAVVLNSEPTDYVTIGLSSSDPTEGAVAPTSLIFDPFNWNVPQAVTLTGVNDDLDDGDIPYSITVTTASNNDPLYDGLSADVSVTNLDDDTAGITVNPTSGLVTTEAGGTATFTVVLNSEPMADVTINLFSDDTTEGTVEPPLLTFDATNWRTPQQVTVRGVNDDLDDDDVAYNIVAVPASDDSQYNDLHPAEVSVTNLDDDTAGITVDPTSGLVTTEAGGTAAFTIALISEPMADVTIGLSSSDTTEGTVEPNSLTFTPRDWGPRTVTVTGVNDDVADGDILYHILTAAAVSSDPLYNGLDAVDVAVTNVENDVTGVLITPTSVRVTEGELVTFTVVLTSRPAVLVRITLSSDCPTEFPVLPLMSFDPDSWNVPQMVTIPTQDDEIDEDDITCTITADSDSGDPDYQIPNAAHVTVTILDNDTAGITVDPTNGLVTTEAVGFPHTARFTVVLRSQPTADVRIDLSSRDTTEGTVAPTSLFFDPYNWSVPQVVTATGVNDDIDDGDIPYTITGSTVSIDDPLYDGLSADVSVTNVDDDTAGITVDPTSGLVTTEAGGAATFTIVLNSEPTDYVTIGLSSSDTAEGTVEPSSLTFDATNWNVPQAVTLTGVNDDLDDGDISYSITVTAASNNDPLYNNLGAADVSVTNLDDDREDLIFDQDDGYPRVREGDLVGASYSVHLKRGPTANVDITLTIDDGQAEVSPQTLSFTPDQWDVDHARLVQVTAVEDRVAEGEHSSTIHHVVVSNDPVYSGRHKDHVVTVLDNDTAGVTVTESGGATEVVEGGGTGRYTVKLNSQPTKEVRITVDTDGQTTVVPASLTFTATTWDQAQTVTVTAVDDRIAEGTPHIGEIAHTVSSSDPSYDEMEVNRVVVQITDNDTAGVTIASPPVPYPPPVDPFGQPQRPLLSEEGPTSDTYTLALDSQPTADVTVTITTDGQTTIAPTSLVFTSANWNAPQTVTVTAVDDFTRELPVHPSTVTHSVSSTDVAYNGMALPDVIASVTDNDQACQDSDGDGLTDDEELAGFTATVYWLGSNQNWQSATVTFTTDPNNPDTDRDGISDFDEVMTYQDGTAEDGSVPGITTADGNPLISCDLRIGLKVYGPGTDFPPGSFEGRKPKSVWGVRTIAGPVSNPPPDLPNIDPKDSDGDGILDPDDPAPQFDPKVMYGSNPRIDQDKLVNFDLDGDGWVELPYALTFSEKTIEKQQGVDYSNDGTLEDGFDIGTVAPVDSAQQTEPSKRYQIKPTQPDHKISAEAIDTDNCASTSNPDQLDTDGDGIGDACQQTLCGAGLCGTQFVPFLPLMFAGIVAMKLGRVRRR